MTKLIAFLRGKKTYIIALVIGALSGAQYLGLTIPEYVWIILGACGLGTLRSAISAIKPPTTTP
jgi:hypothetical protein